MLKKLLSFLLCLIVCASLFSCQKQAISETNSSENTKDTSATTSASTSTSASVTTSTVTNPPKVTEPNRANINTDLLQYDEGISWTNADAFDFDSYDRFLAHLSDEANSKNSWFQANKTAGGESLERLVAELTAKEHIVFPHFDGELITFSNGVSLYPSIYSLGGYVACSGYTNWGRMLVEMYYPHVEEHEDFSEDLSTSEILRLIDPSRLNVHNFTEHKLIGNIYEKDINFPNGVISAIIYEEINPNTFYEKKVHLYCDSVYVIIRMTNDTYNSGFLEHFSIQ